MGAFLQELRDVGCCKFCELYLRLAEAVREKLCSKRNVVQNAGLRKATLVQEIVLVLIEKPLLAVSWLRRLGRGQPRFTQHRQ